MMGGRFTSAMLFAIMASTAYSGGFSLYTEGSAAEVGIFAAGAAAEAQDASIGWYNPAGLVLLQKNEALLSGVGVMPVSKVTGTSTFYTDPYPPYQQSFEKLSGGQQAIVPALHISHPFGPRAVFGLSVVSPFGLSTNWPEDAATRYSATLTKLLTANVSPEMGVLLTDHLAFGAGLDWQYADVKFDGVAGSPAVMQFLESFGAPVTPSFLDSSSNNEGSSIGVGFHTGILTFFNQKHTRVGLNYQSQVKHQFNGHSILKGRAASSTLSNPYAEYKLDGLYSNYVALPDVLTLSAYQDINAQFALLGSVLYTGWSSFKTIELYNVAGYAQSEGQAPINLVTPQDYRNTWRAALGANYHVNERLMLRLGGGYDQTPTVNAERDIRLPDVDRAAISGGLHYQITAALGVDVGYTYLFGLGQSSINKTQVIDEGSSVNIQAQAMNHAQLAGIQAVWNFDAAGAAKAVTK
jgi:long-chain fatty acid transport protein